MYSHRETCVHIGCRVCIVCTGPCVPSGAQGYVCIALHRPCVRSGAQGRVCLVVHRAMFV